MKQFKRICYVIFMSFFALYASVIAMCLLWNGFNVLKTYLN